MKIAIIGGGISGLLCALLLEQKGYTPTLYERLPKVGGVFDSFRRKGILFDIGFHYSGALAKGQYLYEALKRLRVLEKLQLEEYKDAFDILYIDREPFAIKGDTASFQKQLKKSFPLEQKGIDIFFNACLKASKINISADSFSRVDYRSLQDVMFEIKNKKLRKILLHFTIFYFYKIGSCQEASFDIYAKLFINMLEGTRKIVGGGGAIVTALKDSLCSTTIHTRSEVSRIFQDEKGVHAIECNKKKIAYDAVIAAIHPKITLNLLNSLDKKQLRYKQHIESLEESPSFFAIFCLITATINSNLYFYEDDFISVLPSRIYNGKTVATILVSSDYEKYVNLDRDTYKKRKREECAYHIERIKKFYDFGNIEVLECATPLTKQHYSNNVKGGVYGILCSAKQKSHSMLMPKTRMKNLYFAGESIIAPGFLGTFLGAEAVINYFEEKR